MYHAILAFLVGLLHSAPVEQCPYRPMLAYGDNASQPVKIASTIPYAPCSLAGSGRLAQLATSPSKARHIV